MVVRFQPQNDDGVLAGQEHAISNAVCSVSYSVFRYSIRSYFSSSVNFRPITPFG